MHGANWKLQVRIIELLKHFPVVALLGPRQCGKTTLAHEIQSNWQPCFYRTSNGVELDLLMVNSEKIIAFEIKASVAAKLTKGFYTARADIQPLETFIVSRTDETWKTVEGVTHTNINNLAARLSEFAEDEWIWHPNPLATDVVGSYPSLAF